MDEISPLGPTTVVELQGVDERVWTIAPQDFGWPAASAADLAGGDPADNARLIEAVLSGQGPEGARQAVALNAAAALYVAGATATYRDAVALAQTAMQEGRGLEALHRLRQALAPAASA
jgi:anthranilate phosphoribosyltransferase